MRFKQTIALSFLAIAGLTSCEKDLYDPSQAKSNIKVKDLKVADDFSWKMTQPSKCVIRSGNTAVVLSIYQDEKCSENKLLATVPVLPGATPTLPLSLLATNKTVYIQYQNTEGQTVTVPTSVNEEGQIDFQAPSQSNTRAVRANTAREGEQTIIGYYPCFEGGTVMFEDNYPALGDYDFNDFVANYMVEVHTDAQTNRIKNINLYMTVRAIGATKTYIPHFRIRSFGKEYVDHITNNSGEFTNFNPQLLEDEKGKIVIAMNGGEDKFGQEFLNTAKGNKYSLPRKLDVTIHFKEDKDVNFDYLDVDKFDVFLATGSHKEEIHILGNGPAFTLNGYGNDNYYKMSGNNLVWGIDVPERIDHAYEKTNFLDAYPNFAKWVEGNYNSANTWYKSGNSTYLYPMP